MPEIRFTVLAVPVAQPRQRQRAIPTGGGKLIVHNFTPSKHPVRDFKASIRQAAADAYQGPPLDGPIGLHVVFVMPRPGRLVWKRKAMPREWHAQAPDSDNVLKALKDALSELLWRNDAQVAEEHVRKVFAAGTEQPHVEVRVWTLGQLIGSDEHGIHLPTDRDLARQDDREARAVPLQGQL